jgi:glycosyltransferase involved in cell wall biosynthesis
MNTASVYVNASNCHQGGGKTLLDSFIKGLEHSTQQVVIYIDERYNYDAVLKPNIEFVRVGKFARVLVSSKIKKRSKPADEILFFGNLPPILKFKNDKVLLFLQSRFYVDKISLNGFSLKDRIKIYLERVYFKITLKNVTGIIVQTTTMKKLVIQSGFKKEVHTWAFANKETEKIANQKEVGFKEPASFIYVASLFPYKNHKRLLYAWQILKQSGLNPRLYLTIDQNNKLKEWIVDFVAENDLNVVLLGRLEQRELAGFYEKCEVLIYPSFFEAFGLPLIEASKYDLKILASDIDFCWDFITPDDVFNPFDAESIARCVRRYLKSERTLDEVYSAEEFIHKLNSIGT